MKIFKLSFLLFLFIQCGKHNEKPQPEPELEDTPSPCLMGPTIRIDTVFKDFESEIVHYAEVDTAFFIKYKQTKNVNTGFIYACNLPDTFRIDGLKVKISGNVLSNGKSQTRAANPFQLVSIEVNQ